MKHAFPKVNIQLLVCLSLASVIGPVLHAEPHCPGNAASLHLRSVQHSAIVVSVEVNHTGPYDFLVDTGAQITQIDPSLASELHIKVSGTAGMVGVGVYARNVSLVQVNELEAGPRVAKGILAAVQNLSQIQAADPHIRGVLGENFLRNFDVLIDYGHNILCLDETRQMGQTVKGERIPLAMPARAEGKTSVPETLVVPVHLSGGKAPTVHLLLDSGMSGPLLYHRGNEAEVRSGKALIRWAGADGVDQVFAVLAPRDIQIGRRSIPQVSFVSPVGSGNDVPEISADGLLPTALFQRIYINYAEHYVVLNPR